MSTDNKSNIQIEVHLDEDKKPANIKWKSDGDPSGTEFKEAKAMFLSFFERTSKDTLKIDLWVSDFELQEMDRMMFQTFMALTDTYFKATNNKQLAGAMQQFVNYFGEETGIIPKTS